jgi:general secretion pathway protein G
MKNLQRRLARKRIARGVTLIEVMISVAIMALIAAVAAVAVVGVWKDMQKKTAKEGAAAWRHQVGIWRLSHPGDECPTPDRLRADRVTDKGSSSLDPWGSPYAIICADDDVTVVSPGPDKKVGTEDDIIAPPDAKVASGG